MRYLHFAEVVDWRTANDRPDAPVDETERLRDECARLLALFVEARAHPASAWYYVAKALGDPIVGEIPTASRTA